MWRTPDHWGEVIAEIHLVKSLGRGALIGLEDFSHVEVLFWFDQDRVFITVTLDRPEDELIFPLSVCSPTGPRTAPTPLEPPSAR